MKGDKIRPIEMKETDAPDPEAFSPSGSATDGASRRSVLFLIWALVLIVLAVMLRSISAFLAASGPKEKVRYPVPMPERFPFKGAEFWLDRDDQGLFAFLDRCPHLGCKPVYYPDRKEYVCPCHGSRFSEGGIYESGPARKSMQRILVRRGRDDELMVDLRENVSESYRVGV
ncbi:MAG: Rieske (2Fe-2S) protein [Deltaproteobacteria bacterium]|nr:Rieske (2Fe-2S) protein [Deltaproteobacteria bacterium]